MTQRRILVVEDERTIAESVAARLRAEGYAVQIAGDGPAAVAAVHAGRPDLVVLDVMLPGFDGLEVCRRIQADQPVLGVQHFTQYGAFHDVSFEVHAGEILGIIEWEGSSENNIVHSGAVSRFGMHGHQVLIDPRPDVACRAGLGGHGARPQRRRHGSDRPLARPVPRQPVRRRAVRDAGADPDRHTLVVGDAPAEVLDGPRLELPNGAYVLASGALGDVVGLADELTNCRC